MSDIFKKVEEVTELLSQLGNTEERNDLQKQLDKIKESISGERVKKDIEKLNNMQEEIALIEDDIKKSKKVYKSAENMFSYRMNIMEINNLNEMISNTEKDIRGKIGIGINELESDISKIEEKVRSIKAQEELVQKQEGKSEDIKGDYKEKIVEEDEQKEEQEETLESEPIEASKEKNDNEDKEDEPTDEVEENEEPIENAEKENQQPKEEEKSNEENLPAKAPKGLRKFFKRCQLFATAFLAGIGVFWGASKINQHDLEKNDNSKKIEKENEIDLAEDLEKALDDLGIEESDSKKENKWKDSLKVEKEDTINPSVNDKIFIDVKEGTKYYYTAEDAWNKKSGQNPYGVTNEVTTVVITQIAKIGQDGTLEKNNTQEAKDNLYCIHIETENGTILGWVNNEELKQNSIRIYTEDEKGNETNLKWKTENEKNIEQEELAR